MSDTSPILYPNKMDQGGPNWDAEDLEVIFNVVEPTDKFPSESELKTLYTHLKNKYFETWDHRVPEPENVNIFFSGRLTASGANCNGRDTIKISKYYHQKFPYELPRMLAHEIIHFWVGNHSQRFKDVLSHLQEQGCEAPLYTRERAKSRRRQQEEKRQKKKEKAEKAEHILRCEFCGEEYYYQKESKNVRKAKRGELRHQDLQNRKYGNCIGWLEYQPSECEEAV